MPVFIAANNVLHSRRPRLRFLCPLVVLAWSAIVLSDPRKETAAPLPLEPSPQQLALHPDDRILVLAPHPDDETLGCGGIIQTAVAMKIPVKVVFFTNGDNNEWSFLVYRKHVVLAPSAVRQMGEVRHDEAVRAAAALGLPPEALIFLGYPDFGTMTIWSSHWNDAPPYESMLTRATHVPYSNAYRPGALYKGDEILSDLSAIVRAFKPTRLFVSHPADTNPDHRALYLFTRVALWDSENERRPLVYPYLVHFPHWPKPRGDHPSLPLTPPLSLSLPVSWTSFALDSLQVSRMRDALHAHKSQYEYAPHYLASFLRTNELFGDFPALRHDPASPLPDDLSPTHSAPEPLTAEPDLLTEEERALFIGIEKHRIQIADSNVVIRIHMSNPLGKAVSLTAMACGYRHDVSFARMPKLRVEIRSLTAAAYDQTRRLPETSVRIIHQSRDIEIHIPLQALNSPTCLLTSARTRLGEIPLDAVSWRLVELNASPETGNKHQDGPGR